MRPLALHQLAAIEATPAELVTIASELDCVEVCVFVNVPADPLPGHTVMKLDFEVVTQAHKADLLSRMRDLGVKMGNVEYFSILPDGDVERYRTMLELGGELGARGAVVHVNDPEDRRAVDTLGRFRDICAEYNLVAGLEFMGLSPACNSIARAAYFIDQLDRSNIGMAIDMLHVARTGVTAEQIAALDPGYFAYGQLCDGHGNYVSDCYSPEGLDRLMPGEGEWPLHDILTALPAAVPLDVEAPSLVAKKAGMSARDRAAWAVSAAREVLAGVTPVR